MEVTDSGLLAEPDNPLVLLDRDAPAVPDVPPAMARAARRPEQGLSQASRDIYRFLVTQGPLGVATLEGATNLGEGQFREAVEGLLGLGLIQLHEGVLRALPYQDVVDGMLHNQAGMFERMLAQLSDRYRALRTLISERNNLDPPSDLSAMPIRSDPRNGMYDAPGEARTEISTIHPGGLFSDELLERSLATAEQCLRNGVTLRVIHQRAARLRPRQLAYMNEIERLGGRVRLRDNLPFRLLLIDQSAAVCSMGVDGGAFETLMLRNAQMVAMLNRVFEVTWTAAEPLGSAGTKPLPGSSRADGRLTSQQETVLRMLAEGQTDQSIARRLGVTPRTVTRRMGEIYEVLGVDNRFQAGAEAQRMGLV